MDPAAPGSVAAWTRSFGSAFAAVLQRKKVAERLEAEGYVDLYGLVLGEDDFLELTVTEDDRSDSEQLLPAEARRLAVAAAEKVSQL